MLSLTTKSASSSTTTRANSTTLSFAASVRRHDFPILYKMNMHACRPSPWHETISSHGWQSAKLCSAWLGTDFKATINKTATVYGTSQAPPGDDDDDADAFQSRSDDVLESRSCLLWPPKR